MQEKNTLNKKEAIFLLESQPPHLGELISVFLKLREYDFIYICISNAPQVMSLSSVVATWLFLLNAFRDRTAVFVASSKFEEISELPEEMKECVILTTSTKVYVHMASLNIPTELVPKALGYWGVFQRTAYRKGRALDFLRSRGRELK